MTTRYQPQPLEYVKLGKLDTRPWTGNDATHRSENQSTASWGADRISLPVPCAARVSFCGATPTHRFAASPAVRPHGRKTWKPCSSEGHWRTSREMSKADSWLREKAKNLSVGVGRKAGAGDLVKATVAIQSPAAFSGAGHIAGGRDGWNNVGSPSLKIGPRRNEVSAAFGAAPGERDVGTASRERGRLQA